MSQTNPWSSPRLRAAWAARQWGTILREYRLAAGLSQRALEPLVGLPQPHISAIESGRRQVLSADLQERITTGLKVPAELISVPARAAVEPALWAPRPELRERVAHAHTTGRTDLTTARWIAQVLAEHRRAEDQVGGAQLWDVVVSQLDTVTALLPAASGATADRLLLLAAEHAHWLSWVAGQHHQLGPALAWLDMAGGWAAEGGHTDMTSWVLRVRAHYMLHRGDPVRALRTAEAARTAAVGASPATAAVAAHQTALAAAAVAERDRSRRLADDMLALVARAGENRPGWLYWLTPARARLMAADTAYACRDWQTAADGYAAALPDLAGYPRDAAYYRARMEDAQRRL